MPWEYSDDADLTGLEVFIRAKGGVQLPASRVRQGDRPPRSGRESAVSPSPAARGDRKGTPELDGDRKPAT